MSDLKLLAAPGALSSTGAPRECDRDRELRELREKVEQAIVCINAALYVLLQRTDVTKVQDQVP